MRAGKLVRELARDRERGGQGTVARPVGDVLREIIEQCGDHPDCAPLKQEAERRLAEHVEQGEV